ncbi:hypothetical protein [Sphaerisporangium sp. NPDC051011]|uniref:hypothetical protein n=1 Tax=Sphaerisporangium sp. NPDC051011 TaxID=3155792 RepID=UPI0033CA75A9
MLGIETVSLRARKLKNGDYLDIHDAEIADINPTTDPWLPEEALDILLGNGETVQHMPHDFVRVTGDVRELASRA